MSTKMVSLLSTMSEAAISLLSEEQKEAFSGMMVPALVPAGSKRKKNDRAAFVSGLAAWKTGKERKEAYVAKVSEDRRIHIMEGASKDEAGKMFDSLSSIGEKALIEDLGKSVPAGIAFTRGGKVVTTTSAAATIATLSALDRLKAAKHGSKEYREAVAAVEAIKEG